ncbi:MAG: hypothetical protein AB8B61_04500 [Cyclobacteriaceae bacterium]
MGNSEQSIQLIRDYRQATKEMGIAIHNFKDVYLEGEDHKDIRIARENALELLEVWSKTAQKLLSALN